MRNSRKLLILALILAFRSEAKVYQLTESGADIPVPTAIWQEIEKSAKEENVTFSPIRVNLEEKSRGVLIEPELQIELPRGGGEVDLSKFVKDQKGTFRVFFDLDEMKIDKEMKVYFVSRVKKRKIDQEIWGAGCRKWMDVTKYLLYINGKSGLEVNTTRFRHLSLLGGSFIFATGNLVTQVTFKDSTQPQLFCENVPAPSAKKESGED